MVYIVWLWKLSVPFVQQHNYTFECSKHKKHKNIKNIKNIKNVKNI